MKPIKVDYIFESYNLFFQPYITNLVELLKNSQKINLSVKSFKKNPNALIIKDVSVFKSYRSRQITDKIYKIFNKKPTLSYVERDSLASDIIHIQHSFLMFKYKSLLDLPSEKRSKVVITLRGGDTYIKPWVSKKYRNFFKTYGNKVDAFIVMSNHQRDYLLKWDVPKKNINIIPVSFGSKFKVSPKYPNKEILRIISAFRFTWEKNIEGNLRFVKCLIALGVDVQYDIYGAGNEIGQIYYLIDKYELREYVFIKDKIENKILKNLFKEYDFYLQLSLSESLGIAVVESQASGLPVIVSDAGGLPETLDQDKSGFVVYNSQMSKTATRVVELWKNKEAYHTFSQNAITYSHDNFNVEKEVQLLEKLYTNLVTTKST